MKILELRFKNLNSLYGEWHIDFTTPDYSANGIFAIIGPTGAGKSTILDAICLALYGATPRLGKITKNSNQLMSRQTADCFSEVTFESQAGIFRCHWSQQKARKKIDGNLGESKHEIVEANSGLLLESKKRDVAHVIEEKTGMDFERFTRSILLAQGGFSAFLTASPDERAPILEQMTGTKIYSEISVRVHETLRKERDKLALLQAETTGITLLSDDQEQTHHLELLETNEHEESINLEMKKIAKATEWLHVIETLSKEITLFTEEQNTLNKRIIAFQPDRERLQRAHHAIELDGLYATLKGLRKQQKDDQNALTGEEVTLPTMHEMLRLKTQALALAQQNLSDTKSRQKELRLIIQTVCLLDQALAEKKKNNEHLKKDCIAITDQLISKENEFKKQQAALAFNLQEQDIIKQYVNDHSQHAALVSEFAGTEEQLRQVISLQKTIQIKQKNINDYNEQLLRIEAELTVSNTKRSHHQQTWIETKNQVKQKQHELEECLQGRLLREYRAEKENLFREMAFLQKIATLEQERRTLIDGKPCPLCGSETHPFANNNVPERDKTEQKISSLTLVIEQAETLEQETKKLEQSENIICKKITDLDKLISDKMNEKQQVHHSLSMIVIDRNELTLHFNALQEETIKRLRTFGIQDLPKENIEQFCSHLKERLRVWNEKQSRLSMLEKEFFELSSQSNTLKSIIDNQKTSLTEKQKALNAIEDDYAQINQERQVIFGKKNPDSETVTMEKALAEAERFEKIALNAKDDIKRLLENAQVKINTLREQIVKRSPQMDAIEKEFHVALEASDFADEKTYLNNCISIAERNSLSNQAKKIDTEKANLELKLTDRQDRLRIEKDKRITESTSHELTLAFLELETKQKQVRERISFLTVELRNHHNNKERMKDKQLLIESQQMECHQLEKLHSLIGSSDGKKYRNFAQGLTFELMVSHANKQLEKMTDRYLLIRDTQQPLELNVVDNYQAGEIRTTKNLSGGESFIVSLSLALGLSKMASQNVRVDSLFLDEGFGTLDDEALETAIETLSEIQQDGKMIGIISHVTALKERISTQINVQPASGGKSAISGPGCQYIAGVI